VSALFKLGFKRSNSIESNDTERHANDGHGQCHVFHELSPILSVYAEKTVNYCSIEMDLLVIE